MSKIKHILLVIHYTICGAVCLQFTHFPWYDWENLWTLSYFHHRIGNMNYYPLFRVMSWNNDVRYMSFYIPSSVNKLLNKPSSCRSFETPLRSYDVIVMVQTRIPIIVETYVNYPKYSDPVRHNVCSMRYAYGFVRFILTKIWSKIEPQGADFRWL